MISKKFSLANKDLFFTMKLLLIVVVACMNFLAANSMFHYSSESCDDLMPRLKPIKKKEMTTKAPQEKETMGNDTTEEPSTSAEPEPEPEPTLEKGTEEDAKSSLILSDVNYRRHRPMTVTLKSESNLTAFMLQARAVKEENVTRVGRFEKIPKQTSIKDCGESDSRVIGDNGMDLQGLNDITFTWMPPDKDVGRIKFMAGILINHTYYMVESDDIEFKNYPIDSSSCGKSMMCYRSCTSESTCPAWSSDYIFTSKVEEREKLVMTLGAYLPQNSSYVAIGFTNDGKDLTRMDISACLRSGDSSVTAGHFMLEKYEEEPQIHSGETHLLNYDIENDYMWCTFSRPLRGPGSNALTLGLNFYQVYLTGNHNDTTIIMPKFDDIMVSERALNLTEMADIVDYNHAGSISPISLPFISTLFLITASSYYNF